ncbi:MAG: flagellar FliJ family protein [Syntrophales bacterium]|nr:flagellar FliJ family protein [Syntrophales bacterium]MDD5641861.1 flagellar FliJ family protein [Syntrophales bacterium]
MSPVGRFRFSLETVLKVRGLREEQAKAEVARAQLELEKSRQALKETQELRRRLLADLGGGKKEWTPQDFTIFKAYLEHLKLAMEGLEQRIAEQEGIVQEKKEILKQRYQERRLLEQLRQKHYAIYRRELMKDLEKETEAIVLGRWNL